MPRAPASRSRLAGSASSRRPRRISAISDRNKRRRGKLRRNGSKKKKKKRKRKKDESRERVPAGLSRASVAFALNAGIYKSTVVGSRLPTRTFDDEFRTGPWGEGGGGPSPSRAQSGLLDSRDLSGLRLDEFDPEAIRCLRCCRFRFFVLSSFLDFCTYRRRRRRRLPWEERGLLHRYILSEIY